MALFHIQIQIYCTILPLSFLAPLDGCITFKKHNAYGGIVQHKSIRQVLETKALLQYIIIWTFVIEQFFIISFKEGGNPDLSFKFFRNSSITEALYSLHFDQ